MKKERRIARELALKFLFPLEVGGEPETSLRNRMENCGDEACSYAKFLVKGIMERKDEIDKLLSSSTRRNFHNLLPIEKVLLRMGALEILTGLKPSTAINEAVELAKKYGEVSSYRLINAILDSLVRRLQGGKIAGERSKKGESEKTGGTGL